MDLSIIVISYNTREMTLACLRSVYEQTKGISFELIVVDNDSSDGSASAIAENFPQLHLIRSSENLGFAAANNLAALEATGEYLLLLNPDTVVLDGAIQKLLVFARNHPEHGIYGGKTLFADGSLNHASCWQRPTPWSVSCYGIGLTSIFRRSNWFDPEAYGSWQRDAVREVDIVSGCFFLIRKSLWEKLGGFDPVFFMYAEEADLCLRAQKLGAKPIITPEAVIIHYGGASEKIRADKAVRLFKAKSQLIRRHWRPGLASFGVGMYQLAIFLRALVCKGLAASGWEKFRESSTCWNEVWARRAEWNA